MHSTLPPSKGQDLIHRNRLQKLRNQELNTTKSQLTSLHKSIQQRVSIEEELVDTLLVAQQALTTKDATICTLQTELHSLLATKALTQNKERMMAEVKLMSLKNNQLQEAQYHLSMAQADQEIQSLKQQILLHEVRETKQKVEFNSLTSRVGQLQQTVRNVTQLRQKEEHQYQEKIKQVVQQIHLAREDVKHSKIAATQQQRAACNACEQRFSKQLIAKDALLRESREVLRKQKGMNEALQEEIKKLVIRNMEDTRKQAEIFQRSMLNNFKDRMYGKELVQRLASVVEDKMVFISRIEKSFMADTETKRRMS